MKAVWFNSIGTVFAVYEETAIVKAVETAPMMPGDTIRFIGDDDEAYQVGITYDEVRTA
jgi:hypothetical protein